MYRRRSGSFRFGRESRLKSDLVIRDVIRTGKRVHGRYLDFIYKADDDELRQFCIKTPKRIGNAVRRNRLKRVIREILRKNMDRFKLGTRMVIRVKEFPTDSISSQLLNDFNRFFDYA